MRTLGEKISEGTMGPRQVWTIIYVAFFLDQVESRSFLYLSYVFVKIKPSSDAFWSGYLPNAICLTEHTILGDRQESFGE